MDLPFEFCHVLNNELNLTVGCTYLSQKLCKQTKESLVSLNHTSHSPFRGQKIRLKSIIESLRYQSIMKIDILQELSSNSIIRLKI